MNNIKSIISTVVLFLCVGSVSAQHRITGRVYDDIESIPLANVVERDANNRIVEATVTDMNGNLANGVYVVRSANAIANVVVR